MPLALAAESAERLSLADLAYVAAGRPRSPATPLGLQAKWRVTVGDQ